MAAHNPNPVMGQRMHWHLQQQQPLIPEGQQPMEPSEQEKLKKINRVFACWGTNEAQGATDNLLINDAMIFLSDRLKLYILSNDQSVSELCPVCFENLTDDLRYFCSDQAMMHNPHHQATSAFLECGHLFCATCAAHLAEIERMCPLCRFQNPRICQIRDVLRSPSLQANIVRSMNYQLEPFYPSFANPSEPRQWNWFSHETTVANFVSLWSVQPMEHFYTPYSPQLSSQIQAAWEMDSPVVISTSVMNRPCFYYVDPHRQFQLKIVLNFAKQRSIILQNGRFCAQASEGDVFAYSEGDVFAYSDDAAERIRFAIQKKLRILPISMPPQVLYENTSENWSQLYSANASSGGLQPQDTGYCIHLGLMRQVPFKFETTARGLVMMRMVRPGELVPYQLVRN